MGKDFARKFEKRLYPSLLFLFFLLGITLRLWNLPSQILLDDEWHALNFVLDRPFLSLFSAQGVGANSIPVNLWTAFLLHTFGWSELGLRLPSILAGALSLGVLPLLVARRVGRAEALVFSALLAISPSLIFYSRLARPFSMTAFLGTLAFFALWRWQREGRTAYRWLFVGSAFLAIYHHLYAMVVLVPAWAGMAIYATWKTEPARRWPKFSEQLKTGLLLGSVTFVFAGIPLLLNPWFLSLTRVDKVRPYSFLKLMTMISGSSELWLVGLVSILAVAGSIKVFRQERELAVGIFCALFFFLLRVSTTTQEGIHHAIQLLRYGIILVPLFCFLVSVGAVEILRRVFGRSRSGAAAATSLFALVLPCLLFLFGPVRQVYGEFSNFQHHMAYQNSYEPIGWDFSPTRELGEGMALARGFLNPCYRILQNSPIAGLIEYPMYVGDQFNLQFYAQHFHGKLVHGGYRSQADLSGLQRSNDFVFGDSPLDYVFRRVPESRRMSMRFGNLAHLDDLPALKGKYRGWAVFVHRNYLREIYPPMLFYKTYESSLELIDHFDLALGKPICENSQGSVYWIKGGTEPARDFPQ